MSSRPLTVFSRPERSSGSQSHVPVIDVEAPNFRQSPANLAQLMQLREETIGLEARISVLEEKVASLATLEARVSNLEDLLKREELPQTDEAKIPNIDLVRRLIHVDIEIGKLLSTVKYWIKHTRRLMRGYRRLARQTKDCFEWDTNAFSASPSSSSNMD